MTHRWTDPWPTWPMNCCCQHDNNRLFSQSVYQSITLILHPSKFQRVSRLGFVTAASDVAHRRPTKRCTVFDRILALYTIYTFLGALSPHEILPCAKFILLTSKSCVLVYWQRYCTALAAGVSQTLRRWAESATYIRQGGHHVGHWPAFLVYI